MAKRRYADSELELLQRLKHENKKLKRDNQQLRKQLARVDLNRFQNLKDTIEDQEEELAASRRKEDEEKQAQEWECWSCHKGSLQLVVFERRDGVFYLRKCSNCNKRTSAQKYTDSVKGVRKK